jgi:hypothetical protein
VRGKKKQIVLEPNMTDNRENSAINVRKPSYNDIVRVAGKGCYLNEDKFNNNINEKIIKHKIQSENTNLLDVEKLKIQNNKIVRNYVDDILDRNQYKYVPSYLEDPLLSGNDMSIGNMGTLNDVGRIMIIKPENGPQPQNMF